MDPLSVAASVTSLFTLTIQLISVVESTVKSIKTQPTVLLNTIQELTALKYVLERLEKFVASNQTPSSEDEALKSVLNGCKDTYHSIGKELAGIQAKLKNPMSKLYTQMTFTSRMKDLSGLRDQLEKYKSTLIIALHLRTLETSPDDLRKEISSLRVELNAFNSRPATHDSRLGAIQHYLMTTSNIVERKTFPTSAGANRDSQSIQTMSSTTLVPSLNSPRSPSVASQETNLETFQSFEDWLGRFAPTSEESNQSEIDANIASLRLANNGLQTKPKTPNVGLDSLETPLLFKIPRKIAVTVMNLEVKGQVEEISIGTDAQLYELIQILHLRGHTDVCGFETEFTTIAPIAPFDSSWPIVVTDGPSSYNLRQGLLINQNESLAEFYDNLLTVDYGTYKPRSTFSVDRKIHGLLIEDLALNRALENLPGLTITFDRTLRVPEDGQTYHLPAILGTLPLLMSEHFKHRLPGMMARKAGGFLPLFQREAMVISFRSNGGESDVNYAIKVFAGSVNAVSGELATEAPRTEQDYVIAPSQQRLDGFCSEKGAVKQFVAMPIGFNYTAEKQLTEREYIGGIQLQIAPKFKGVGHFSLEGHQRDFGSLKETIISAPDRLDRYKTPRELGIQPGRRIFVEGHEITELSKSLLVDEKFATTLTNRRLFTRCEKKCRSTFVHEMYTRAKDQLPSTSETLKLIAIRPISITIQLGSAYLEGGVRSAVQYYSQFLDVVDFKNQLMDERHEAARYIYFNGVTHDDSPPFYDPIESYHLDSGKITFSPAWMSAGDVFSAGDDITEEKATPSSWEMGLAAGGGIHQEICKDPDPQVWNWKKSEFISIQILNSVVFEHVTGIKPPPCPISVQDYVKGRMPFYHIVQSSPIEGSGILKSLRSVGKLDSSVDIPIGVSMRKNTGPSGCAVCQKNLCDSIIRPCNHIFCYDCIQTHIMKNVPTKCVACLKLATEIVEFSAPMEIPNSKVEEVEEPEIKQDEMIEEVIGNIDKESPTKSQPSDATKPTNPIVPDAFKSLTESLGLQSNSPEYSKLFELIQNIQSRASPLQEAARTGNVEEVQQLITSGSALDDAPAEKGGRTALQGAAENGHLKVVRTLLDAGVSPNEDPAPENGLDALQAASKAGNVSIVKTLLNHGANPNASPCRLNGKTALQAAAAGGHLPIVQQIVHNGADLGALCCQPPKKIEEHVNCTGRTAIYFAAEKGYDSVVQFLLQMAALQHLRMNPDSALLAAARNGHLAVVKTLFREVSSQIQGDSKTTPLHEAAAGGHKEIAIFLLEHGGNINAQRDEKETALYLAAKHGHQGLAKFLMSKTSLKPPDEPEQAKVLFSRPKMLYEPALHLSAKDGDEAAVRLLLKLGFNPDGNTGKFEATPLFYACEYGHTNIVEILLDKGANIYGAHPVRDGRSVTALHLAAKNGHVEAVELLLSRGHSPKFSHRAGHEAIHVAARAGHTEIVRILLKEGANPCAEGTWEGHPIHQAAAGHHESTIHLLLDHGADPLAKGHLSATPLDMAIGSPKTMQIFIDLGADINAPGWHDETPLHRAVKQLSVESVKLLLEKGADPHAKSRDDQTMLHHLVPEKWGVRVSGGEDHVELSPGEEEKFRSIIWILLEQGLDINMRSGSSGGTILDRAIKAGNLSAVRILFGLGVHLDLAMDALHVPSSQNLYEIVKILLEKGSDPNTTSYDGSTPLHLAAKNGWIRVVQHLLKHGAEVNIRKKPKRERGLGETPLHVAASRGYYAVVDALLDHGADPDVEEEEGETPLHLAAANKHPQVVWRLIQHGADQTLLNDEGWSVEDLAARRQYNEAVLGVLKRAK